MSKEEAEETPEKEELPEKGEKQKAEESAAPEDTEKKKEEEEASKPDPAAKWTKRVLVLCILFFVWYLIADRYTPFTSQARVRGYIIPVVPQVSGKIEEVKVGLNEPVKAGQLLATIETEDYELVVADAKAALEQAGQDVGASTSDIAAATAKVAQAQAELEHAEMRGGRIFLAEKSGAVSEAEGDQARSQIELSKAKVEDAKAQLEQARRKLGDTGRNNPAIKSAESALANAELDLSRTRVIAPGDGGVTNVIVEKGQYATAGQPLMTFVSSRTVWIEAFLRENNLEHLKEGDRVDIVLDSAPGRIFHGKVLSIGYGVDWGGTSTASQLPKVSTKKDWLRDPQRFPVAIVFDESKVTPRGKKLLREGSQVDVIVYSEKSNKVLDGIGKFWIKMVSILSYVR